MNKTLLSLFIIAIAAVSCKKEQDPFQISKQHIGLLTDSTQVKDLKAIYSNDSIVRQTNQGAFMRANYDIEIYDKTGNELLVLSPKRMLDSLSTIETVKILDSRFKTEKGISTASTFADIKNNYKISSIQNTLKNVVVFVNEINAFFTIDKEELPAELRFDINAKIEAIQIPDKAKIKYFMIGW
ncbi:hypothetical protein [Corallibacter sp.]|uniref:hypothetical protein n=1 Tax=Corallibacter sp. TaxID=2038084 RepID=UPI003AB1CD23